ncbi:hypothetical protein EON63_20205 [archaeon]|nr:MAG: hypothetical protein EON63_20205 [archaeon]
MMTTYSPSPVKPTAAVEVSSPPSPHRAVVSLISTGHSPVSFSVPAGAMTMRRLQRLRDRAKRIHRHHAELQHGQTAYGSTLDMDSDVLQHELFTAQQPNTSHHAAANSYQAVRHNPFFSKQQGSSTAPTRVPGQGPMRMRDRFALRQQSAHGEGGRRVEDDLAHMQVGDEEKEEDQWGFLA